MRICWGMLIIFLLSFTHQQPDFVGQSDSLQIAQTVDYADSLKRIGRIPESITVLQEIQKKSDSLDNGYLVQLVNSQLADSYIASNRYAKAEELLKHTLQKYPSGEKKTDLLSLLGNTYRYQGRYQLALAKQEEAKAMVDSSAHPNLFGKIKFNIATVYGEMGNYGLAFKNYLQSIKLAEASSDSILLSKSLNSVGLAYNNNGQFDKAQYYLRRAIAINNALQNKLGLLRSTHNLALSLQNVGKADEAINQFNKALELHNEVRPQVPPFRILYNLGQLHKEQGTLDQAVSYYKQSLEYCKKANIMQGLIYNYGGLGDVAEQQERFSDSETYYEQALDVARDIGAAALEREALKSLYNLKKRIGNYSDALSYYERFVSLSDSLEKVSHQQEIDETQAQLDLRQQKEINQLLKEKQAEQEARITIRNWFIGVGVVIILVVLISLYLLYSSNEEKKRMNEELKSKQRKLAELNKVKSKILAILSHDLRSPMSSLKGMLYLLRHDDLSKEEMVKQAAELEVRIDQNISMMDNLLAWGQQQMSGISVDTGSVDANTVVDEVFEELELQARKKKITLTNDITDNLKVEADYNLLKLIFRNLISNSIKFSEAGDDVTIRAQPQSGTIIFEVRDTGIGIPQNKLPHLFTIDGGSRAGTDNEKGSGLGLKLCKEFIEKQNGEIWVESTEGVGTNFAFSLSKASSN